MAYINCHNQFGPVDCATLANRPGQFYGGGTGYGQSFCYSHGGFLVNCARGTGDCDCFIPSGPAPTAPAPRSEPVNYAAPGVTASSPLPVAAPAAAPVTASDSGAGLAPDYVTVAAPQASQAPAPSTKVSPWPILFIAALGLMVLMKGRKNVRRK